MCNWKQKKLKSPDLSNGRNDDNDGEDDNDILEAVGFWAKQVKDPIESNHDNPSAKVKQSEQDIKVRTSKIKAHPKSNAHKRNSLHNNAKDTPVVVQRKRNIQQFPAQSSSTNHKTYDAVKFSLYLSQLPYDSTEDDIANVFKLENETINVISIRLVYDKHSGSRKFRGVAFVDVSDETSYTSALSMNNKAKIKKRVINIRPTKTHSELAEIVKKRENMLKLQKERNVSMRKDLGNNGSHKKKRTKHNSSKESTDGVSKQENEQEPQDLNKSKQNKSKAKISKKERAKKAAILRQLSKKWNTSIFTNTLFFQ